MADEFPAAGVLPVPDQPVQTDWIPELTATGEATKALMLVPLSYQPFAGDGEL